MHVKSTKYAIVDCDGIELVVKAGLTLAEHPNSQIGIITKNPEEVKKALNQEKFNPDVIDITRLKIIEYNKFVDTKADFWIVDNLSAFLQANNIYFAGD